MEYSYKFHSNKYTSKAIHNCGLSPVNRSSQPGHSSSRKPGLPLYGLFLLLLIYSSSLTYRKSALLFRPKSAHSKRLVFCFYRETEILPSTSNPPPHFIVPNISNLLIWTNFCVMSKPDTKIFSQFCIRFHVYPIFLCLIVSFFLSYLLLSLIPSLFRHQITNIHERSRI